MEHLLLRCPLMTAGLPNPICTRLIRCFLLRIESTVPFAVWRTFPLVGADESCDIVYAFLLLQDHALVLLRAGLGLVRVQGTCVRLEAVLVCVVAHWPSGLSGGLCDASPPSLLSLACRSDARLPCRLPLAG